MFDAKSLFEMMVKGAGDQGGRTSGGRSAQEGLPDLSDLLRQFTEGGNQGSSGRAQPAGQTGSGGGNVLEDLMRQFGPKNNADNDGGGRGSGSTKGGNPLEDLLRQFTQEKRGDEAPSGHMRELPDVGDRNAGGGAGDSGAGGLGDLLGEVFGQGRQTAGKAGENAKDTMREMLEKIGGSGANAQDMLGQLTDFISNNKVGAAAALGGLGALVFGTRTGRSVAMGAAKLGAMAVVGGLAYKAYQNYSQGRPMVSEPVQPEAAPAGTGFEADVVSDAATVTYIRGMIAAAAADGRIDASEQQKMIGTLSQQGLDAGAEEFLANELNNPASIDDLANGVTNQTEALQLYTAARVAIEPDTGAEQQFLAVLADRLGIAPDLRAHVDAAARGMV